MLLHATWDWSSRSPAPTSLQSSTDHNQPQFPSQFIENWRDYLNSNLQFSCSGRKKNPGCDNATEDGKKEVINEELETNDVWIPTMKTKLVLKKMMNRKKKFLDLSFSVPRSDFNKC